MKIVIKDNGNDVIKLMENKVVSIKNQELDLVYVGTFGNETRGGPKKHWVNIRSMEESKLYKYATIKTFIGGGFFYIF